MPSKYDFEIRPRDACFPKFLKKPGMEIEDWRHDSEHRWFSVLQRPASLSVSRDWVAAALAVRLVCGTRMLREAVDVHLEVRGSVPVLRGTRFPVSQVLAELADGRHIYEVAEDYDLEASDLESLLGGMAMCLERPVAR